MADLSYNELQDQIQDEIRKLMNFAEKMVADRALQERILKDQES